MCSKQQWMASSPASLAHARPQQVQQLMAVAAAQSSRRSLDSAAAALKRLEVGVTYAGDVAAPA